MTGSKSLPFQMEMEFSYGVAKELWPNVRRIVANNPGDYTHNGTNSYLIGKGDVALIDPGPNDKAHVQAILGCLTDAGEALTDILITHRHKDHTGATEALRRVTGARVCAFTPDLLPQKVGAYSTSHIDYDLKIDVALQEGYVVAGPHHELKALYTPGHAVDHLCYELMGQKILFSGDHVMAWNTSVIVPPDGSMNDYMQSLNRLLEGGYERFMPGHGGQARTPLRLVKAFLMHRKMRERDIVSHIKAGRQTIGEMVPLLYPTLNSNLVQAASLSVLSHLIALIEKQVIFCACAAPSLTSAFVLHQQHEV